MAEHRGLRGVAQAEYGVAVKHVGLKPVVEEQMEIAGNHTVFNTVLQKKKAVAFVFCENQTGINQGSSLPNRWQGAPVMVGGECERTQLKKELQQKNKHTQLSAQTKFLFTQKEGGFRFRCE